MGCKNAEKVQKKPKKQFPRSLGSQAPGWHPQLQDSCGIVFFVFFGTLSAFLQTMDWFYWFYWYSCSVLPYLFSSQFVGTFQHIGRDCVQSALDKPGFSSHLPGNQPAQITHERCSWMKRKHSSVCTFCFGSHFEVYWNIFKQFGQGVTHIRSVRF